MQASKKLNDTCPKCHATQSLITLEGVCTSCVYDRKKITCKRCQRSKFPACYVNDMKVCKTCEDDNFAGVINVMENSLRVLFQVFEEKGAIPFYYCEDYNVKIVLFKDTITAEQEFQLQPNYRRVDLEYEIKGLDDCWPQLGQLTQLARWLVANSFTEMAEEFYMDGERINLTMIVARPPSK